ncbi:MAG: DUF4394 domain-containing protein [Planctomycetes bacterium]|nr:DUF4394 domain-containing protein [Planctomycetota bacterium]
MNTLITLAAVMNLSVCGGVKTGRLLGLDGGSFDALFEIDVDTGEATWLFNFDVNPGGGALAVGPDGTLFASFRDINALVIVNPDTGDWDVVGTFSFKGVAGLAFAPDGTLYGIDNVSDQLVTIDPQTGNGAAVGPTGILSNDGLSFTADGTLYLVGTPTMESSILYTVDPATGQATEVGPFGSNLRYSSGIGPIGDVLYASAYDPFEPPYRVLVTLNPETGEATKVGGFCPFKKGCPNMNGLAFLPGPGDVDRDGDVDQDDYDIFVSCFTGPDPGRSCRSGACSWTPTTTATSTATTGSSA